MNKVRVGFFSFTEVTDPAEHRSYNEWHQLDHMPEQYPLAGIAYGQRWVSTPACRAARAVDETPLDATHYLTLYLMTDPVDRTLEEFWALGQRLHGLGRFHRHRHAHLSGPFRLAQVHAAPRVLVSAEAVPYRPNRGVYVVVEEAGPAGDDAPVAAALEVPGVAGAWTFEASPGLGEPRWRNEGLRIIVCYLDDEPVEVAARLGPVLTPPAGAGARRSRFAGPFEMITPWHWDWFDTVPSAR